MDLFGKLIEDLRVLVLGPQDPVWPHLQRLTALVDSTVDSPEQEFLTNDELRALHGFRITLYRAAAMERDTMLKHVLAHWMGTVDQALRKLPIGPEAEQCIQHMIAGSEFAGRWSE